MDENEAKAWRADAAMHVVTEYRAAVLELDPKTLSAREVVVAFGLATKAGNMIARRVAALRKGANLLFTGEHALAAGDRSTQITEQVLFEGARKPTAADIVIVRLSNSAFGQRLLSVEKALALVAAKKPSAMRMVMEKTPRPPDPPPHFSAEKFRNLIDKEVITQAEYDACLEPAPPAPTMTVDVPSEIEEALARMLLREPLCPEDDGPED